MSTHKNSQVFSPQKLALILICSTIAAVGSHALSIYIFQPNYFYHDWRIPLTWYLLPPLITFICYKTLSRLLRHRPKRLKTLLIWGLLALLAINGRHYLFLKFAENAHISLMYKAYLAILLLSTAAMFFFKKQAHKITVSLSLVIGLSSIFTDVYNIGLSLSQDNSQKSQVSIPSSPPEEVTYLSSPPPNSPVFHIILDEFSTEKLEEFGELDGQFFPYHFEGIYYRQALSNSNRTAVTLAQLNSGRLTGSSKRWVLQGDFAKRGYQVNIFSSYPLGKPCPQGAYFCIKDHEARNNLKNDGDSQYFVLNRTMLYSLLRRLNLNRLKLWFDQYFSQNNSTSPQLALFNEFSVFSKSISEGPSYSYLHVMLPHSPFIHSKDCRVKGDPSQPMRNDEINDIGYESQVYCANKLVTEFLNQLKELGLYDKSFIVVQSDHGTGHGYRLNIPRKTPGKIVPLPKKDLMKSMDTRARTLLWIKPPGFKEKKVSERPVMLLDVQKTLRQWAGIISEQHLGVNLLAPQPANLERDHYYLGVWERVNEESYAFFFKHTAGDGWQKVEKEEALEAEKRNFLRESSH